MRWCRFSRKTDAGGGGTGADSRVIVPLLGLVGGALLLIGVSVYLGSAKQDALAREAKERAVALAQRSLARAMSNNARDLAYWDDAVRFLALSLDETWADGNVGPYLFEAFGYELSLVVDGSDRVIYGHLDGERDTAGAAAILGTAAPELAAAARVGTGELPEAVAGVVATTDATYLVAGAQIVVQSGSALVQPEGKRAVLVLAKRLDDDYLAGLAGDLGLEDLNLRAAAPPAPLATAALLDVGGRPVQWLGWRPHRPGSRQLVWLVPALFGATAVFCGLAILVLRNIKASTLAIRQSEARFRDIAEAASDWIWETDSGLGLVYLSDQCTQATGLVPSETLGRALHDLWPVAGDADLGRRQHEALAARAPFRDVLCRLRTASDGIRILRLAGKPVADSRGGFRGYRGTASDITSETAALEQARYLAEYDMLTGLPNRLLLHERLKDVLARCRRYAGRGAVLCLDLDRFKDVNDTLGHAAGDALLVGGTRRLRECVREADLVARLGGDEFAIVQTEIGQLGDVQQLCKRILRRFAEPFDLDDSEVLVTASIGVALVPTDGEDAAKLLQNADIALYRAKAAGRNQFCFFEAGMDREVRERKRLEADLRVALNGGQLQVLYQPQVDTGTLEVTGVEGLIRWHHPQRGAVPPAEFVPIAEETGLIVPIGEWVLRTACRDAVRWPGVTVSINVSPVQFQQRNLVEAVEAALAEAGLPAQRLELEVTEGLLLQDTAAALATLRRLKALGVRIAMDDFGTGYSSLSYLQKFPFDKIKIDKSFVGNLDASGDASPIVRAIVNLGEGLSIRTCAEGVETPAQLARLRDEGCQEIQGFLFGRPMAVGDIDAMLVSARQPGRKPPPAPAGRRGEWVAENLPVPAA